ncbi:MAG: hypothetical protein RBS89_06770 [Candidatus Delongbacteria bacterium]|jgi:hypothetical protein|nr:hypothetical protein [Candidatus Delongbacteria bacterium]
MIINSRNKTTLLKKETSPLTFIKGTPVLPALSKKNVDEIIDLLEELDVESRFYEEEDSSDA